MLKFSPFRPSAAVAAAAMAFLTGCSPDTALSPNAKDSNAVSALILGASESYIERIGTTATFDLYTANQIGRSTGQEFWDNLSDDGKWDGVSLGCSIGFYATDRMLPTTNGCGNESAGSVTNAKDNKYKYMWNEGKVLPASFAFSAGTTFDVTLKGAFSGGTSDVGYYTQAPGALRKFHVVPSWSSKKFTETVPITAPAGGTWGFFIANNLASGIEQSVCGTIGEAKLKVACSDATGGFLINPFQQFALLANLEGTKYLVGAEDKTVRYAPNSNPSVNNDSDYNDYIWSVVPRPAAPVCDFMTFGRTQIVAANGDDVVISGNAGGNAPQGGILGNFLVKVGAAQYNLQDIAFYGPITDGGVFSGSDYPNARVIVGKTKEGFPVEIRIYDGGEPGRISDAVYLRIGDTTPLGEDGTALLNRGNIQYHAQCRGPGSN